MNTARSPQSRSLRVRHLLVAVFLIFITSHSAQAQKCQADQKSLDALIAQRSVLTTELRNPAITPANRATILQQLKSLAPKITAAQNVLAACLRPVAGGTVAALPVNPPAAPNCSSFQTAIANLVAYRAEISKELGQPNITPAERSTLQEQLRLLGESLSADEVALKQCQSTTTAPNSTAPQQILQIKFNNPTFDETKYKFDWGREFATGSSDPTNTNTFPENIGREWIQVLDPTDDYDRSIVGASGWTIHPRSNTSDFPFDHPFQPDWETSLALDMNQDGSSPFTFLLSHGDKATIDHPDQLEDESDAAARGLPTFVGLLGIEMDQNLIPTQFKQTIAEGNRFAAFGRWIIDAGHTNYRAEIHQPLMMAEAAAITGTNGTRALFTSRPFLVSNSYTTDQSRIYDDSGPDDGFFFPHMIKEVAKVLGLDCTIPDVPCSTLVEAHVKVKSYPFQGIQIMHFLVRPPSTPLHQILTNQRLVVSFHFTVRSGCAVQVISSAADTADVIVLMNSVGYHPPALPTRNTHNYSKDELNALDSGAGSEIFDIQAVSDLVGTLTGTIVKGIAVNEILGRGVQGDQYVSQSDTVNMLTTANAVENAPLSAIPPNAGITQDDTQPYPVTGWLELKWVPLTVGLH